MGKTSIEWTDHSINPITARHRLTNKTGHYCEKVSSGCANCYASTLQKRFGMPEFPGKQTPPTMPIGQEGFIEVGDLRIFLSNDRLEQVYRRKIPTKFFWCDMSDLFGSWVPDGWIVRCLEVMYLTPHHTHQILTKRPDRMADFFRRWTDLRGEPEEPQLARGPEETRQAHPSGRGQLFAAKLETMGTPPPGCGFPTFDWMEGPRWWPDMPGNLWVGTSVENQSQAWRVSELCKIPEVVRFVSCEPLLGRLNLQGIDNGGGEIFDALTGTVTTHRRHSFQVSDAWPIDWVIVGGESGRNGRPMHPFWAQFLRDQCQITNTPFFFKQWGEWAPGCVDGKEHVFFCDSLDHEQDAGEDGACPECEFMAKVGKAKAGRTLDGREWSEFPKSHLGEFYADVVDHDCGG